MMERPSMPVRTDIPGLRSVAPLEGADVIQPSFNTICAVFDSAVFHGHPGLLDFFSAWS